MLSSGTACGRPALMTGVWPVTYSFVWALEQWGRGHKKADWSLKTSFKLLRSDINKEKRIPKVLGIPLKDQMLAMLAYSKGKLLTLRAKKIYWPDVGYTCMKSSIN